LSAWVVDRIRFNPDARPPREDLRRISANNSDSAQADGTREAIRCVDAKTGEPVTKHPILDSGWIYVKDRVQFHALKL